MAIRDIFKMIKADRYTSDGREELIKAQEAVTEDVTYKPGDISRKTGLQKQPDGSWAPVKNAPAQKKSDKTTPEEKSKIKTLSAQYKNAKTDAEKDRIANEVNKIMGVEEKMKAEQSAPGWRAPGSESDPNTEGSIAWYAQQAKKSPSASGSGLSERAQYSVSQTAAGMSTEALKSHVDKLKNDPATRNSVSNPDAMAKAYESELAKRGETVTKMSDLVAQKSRPDSAPTGRQPTPEMLERDRLRHTPEFQARRDKLDAEHPRTEIGAPAEPKHTLEVGSEVKFKKSGQPITIKEIENYGGTPVVVGEYDHNGKKETNRFRLDELEYEEEEKKPTSENKIAEGNTVKFKRTGQPIKIKKVENYGGTPVIVGEYEHNGKTEENRFRMDEISTDSAPRILTGDCKVKIKKSK